MINMTPAQEQYPYEMTSYIGANSMINMTPAQEQYPYEMTSYIGANSMTRAQEQAIGPCFVGFVPCLPHLPLPHLGLGGTHCSVVATLVMISFSSSLLLGSSGVHSPPAERHDHYPRMWRQ